MAARGDMLGDIDEEADMPRVLNGTGHAARTDSPKIPTDFCRRAGYLITFHRHDGSTPF